MLKNLKQDQLSWLHVFPHLQLVTYFPAYTNQLQKLDGFARFPVVPRAYQDCCLDSHVLRQLRVNMAVTYISAPYANGYIMLLMIMVFGFVYLYTFQVFSS